MAELDLVIRGGHVVTAGSDAVADIGIARGTIAQIGGDLQAREEIDAAGKLVFPGVVDVHVHLSLVPGEMHDPTWVEDFASGSAAAAAGGVTTVGNMSFLAKGELPMAGLERELAVAQTQASVDFLLHPVLASPTPEVLAQIPMLRDQGFTSIKYFMSEPGFDAQAQGFVEVTRRAGELGMISMIHCEDAALIGDATHQLVHQGHTALRYYPQSRPDVAEVVATQRAISIAEATGAPIYIVHLSSARALEACAEAQARGLPVYVETRPLYLHLSAERFEEEGAGRYVGQPPLREPGDIDALWHGLRQGTVHTVCTDHAPWSLAAKLDPAHSITRLRPGVENLQVMLPMLYSEGVRQGRISVQRMVEVLSTNAAKLFGLYPRKGTIAVGSDADVVIFDPTITRRIEGSMLKGNCDYSPYEGWEVTGWPVLTLRRGEVVYRDGEALGRPGSGMLLRRGASGSL
jgi:dihydropyrimidinase